MGLAQLVYISRRDDTLDTPELDQIVLHSAINNARLGITGVLMCCGRDLMQLLEGEQSLVQDLFTRISQDPRHHSVRCLLTKPVRKRLFPEWGMGLADLQTRAVVNRDRLMRMVEDVRLNLTTTDLGVEARILISDFKQQLATAA